MTRDAFTHAFASGEITFSGNESSMGVLEVPHAFSPTDETLSKGRFGYADPPYLGCCRLYDHFHPDEKCWDDPATHAALIARLTDEFPDGWALSLSAPSLQTILALCPSDVRVSAWCKTWHQIRPKVPVQFAWEPVILRGGRKRANNPMVRDWLACPATRMRGTPGAKPDEFCFWVFDQLGLLPDDEFVDLFPGSGAVTEAWASWRGQTTLGLTA